jgi:hypothetical protein
MECANDAGIFSGSVSLVLSVIIIIVRFQLVQATFLMNGRMKANAEGEMENIFIIAHCMGLWGSERWKRLEKYDDNSLAKHVHQKHNNVSIKIELVTNGMTPSWKLFWQ